MSSVLVKTGNPQVSFSERVQDFVSSQKSIRVMAALAASACVALSSLLALTPLGPSAWLQNLGLMGQEIYQVGTAQSTLGEVVEVASAAVKAGDVAASASVRAGRYVKLAGSILMAASALLEATLWLSAQGLFALGAATGLLEALALATLVLGAATLAAHALGKYLEKNLAQGPETGLVKERFEDKKQAHLISGLIHTGYAVFGVCSLLTAAAVPGAAILGAFGGALAMSLLTLRCIIQWKQTASTSLDEVNSSALLRQNEKTFIIERPDTTVRRLDVVSNLLDRTETTAALRGTFGSLKILAPEVIQLVSAEAAATTGKVCGTLADLPTPLDGVKELVGLGRVLAADKLQVMKLAQQFLKSLSKGIKTLFFVTKAQLCTLSAGLTKTLGHTVKFADLGESCIGLLQTARASSPKAAGEKADQANVVQKQARTLRLVGDLLKLALAALSVTMLFVKAKGLVLTTALVGLAMVVARLRESWVRQAAPVPALADRVKVIEEEQMGGVAS